MAYKPQTTRNTAREIAQALGGFRKGARYAARCPAHGGRSVDSLSIRDGHSGRAVFHCFGGCTFPEIAAALERIGIGEGKPLPAPIVTLAPQGATSGGTGQLDYGLRRYRGASDQPQDRHRLWLKGPKKGIWPPDDPFPPGLHFDDEGIWTPKYDRHGRTRAVSVIRLEADGSQVKGGKRTYGTGAAACGFMVPGDGWKVALCEGLADAMAVAHQSGWPAFTRVGRLDAGLNETIAWCRDQEGTVVLVPDTDHVTGAGEDSATKLSAVLAKEGIQHAIARL